MSLYTNSLGYVLKSAEYGILKVDQLEVAPATTDVVGGSGHVTVLRTGSGLAGTGAVVAGASGNISILPADGADVTFAGATGGLAGGLVYTGGIGGSADTGTGGVGGGFIITTGAGGAAATGTAGNSGAVTLRAGVGAVSTVGAGGSGGLITIAGGVGGVGSTTGGTGSSIVCSAGNGGVGATGGVGGAVSISSGAGAATNGRGGDITIAPGLGSGTGRNGMVITQNGSFHRTTTPGAVAAAGTATAKDLLGGYIAVGATAGAGYNWSTCTGTELSTAMGTAQAGDSFEVVIIEVGVQIGTLYGGGAVAGMTTLGTEAVGASGMQVLKFVCTGANAFTVLCTVYA